MSALLMLWSAALPALPIMFGKGNLLFAVASAALALCAVGLWLERERVGNGSPAPGQRAKVADRPLRCAA